MQIYALLNTVKMNEHNPRVFATKKGRKNESDVGQHLCTHISLLISAI